MYNYFIKPYDTILIPVMDQWLGPTEMVTINVSMGNAISYYICGIEATITDVDYASVKRMGANYMDPTSKTLVTSSTKDRIIKGMILCSTTSVDRAVTIEFGTFKILQSHVIKSYNAILVPCMDHILPAGEIITGMGSGVNYYITGQELT